MFRRLLLLFPLAVACSAAKPTDYSTDMVMLQGTQTIQTMKLYVSGQKSRVEGFTAGPLGKIVTIARKDKGVTWTLYLDKRQYTEKALAAGSQPGKPDLSNFDLGNMKKENLGRETVLGYPCTKMRVTMGNLPNGQPMVATAWVADSLELPLRLETMGITQENRNLKVGPQPASLFEIPAGFTKTNAPGMPAGMKPPAGAGTGRPSGRPIATGADVAAGRVAGIMGGALSGRVAGPGQTAGLYGGRQGAVTAALPAAAAPAWKVNTNLPGGDYRAIDMATADPTGCKAACDKEAKCKSWTLVKPDAPGGMGYCWLKGVVPQAIAEDCCISGIKGASAGGKPGAVTASPRPAAPAWKLNTNLPGGDYRAIDMATSNPTTCKAACDKEAQCKSWTLVKPDAPGGMGYCWLKDSVPPAISEACCISGVKR